MGPAAKWERTEKEGILRGKQTNKKETPKKANRKHPIKQT